MNKIHIMYVHVHVKTDFLKLNNKSVLAADCAGKMYNHSFCVLTTNNVIIKLFPGIENCFSYKIGI